MENVVFQNKNREHRVCEIVEHDDCYEIRIQGRRGRWRNAFFSKDAAALSAVCKAIEEYGNPANDRGMMVFQAKGVYAYSLAQVLRATYQRVDLTCMRGRHVRFLNGDVSNLRKENLAHNSVVQTVRICGEEYIILRHIMTNGVVKYSVTNYEAELFEILNSCSWWYKERDQGFEASLGCHQERYAFPFVVWAYHRHGLTFEGWRQQCQELSKLFREENLSIDHKQVTGELVGKWDCRIENLQAIRQGLNSAKRDCTKVLQEDCGHCCGRTSETMRKGQAKRLPFSAPIARK